MEKINRFVYNYIKRPVRFNGGMSNAKQHVLNLFGQPDNAVGLHAYRVCSPKSTYTERYDKQWDVDTIGTHSSALHRFHVDDAAVYANPAA